MSIRVHPRLKQWLLPGLILGYLWFTLINNLRLEWSVNPQYGYGWAVPFLCLYLIYLRSQKSEDRNRGALARISVSGFRFQILIVAVVALLWLPIRLVQEANPEWRLVSWALALDVVGLTLLVIQMPGIRSKRTELTSDLCHLCSAVTFPLLFFLVAVPWPTVIEGPLIQALTRANATCAIELLNLFGIPAVQHGNLIEVGSGVVGIDEACSGIRSFQASLMISLFFGELYRLKIGQRILFVLAGFGLSFVFNVGRTTLLTWVAARDGVAAIERWHDTAGVTILVACFVSLWLLSLFLSRRNGNRSESGRDAFHSAPDSSNQHSTAVSPPSPPRPGTSDAWEAVEGIRKVEGPSGRASGGERVIGTEGEVSISPSANPHSAIRIPQSPGPSILHLQPRLLWSLAAWLLFSEIAVEGWYRWHEQRVPAAAMWTVAWPTNNPTFKPLPFSAKTTQFLRQDEGFNAGWISEGGLRWQVVFLRWNPGKIAVHLARGHTPQACLPASGRQIASTSEVRLMEVGGLPLPFRHYVASDAGRPLHVFYCLWEDRGTEQDIRPTGLTLRNRLDPVLAGHRNLGQRSVELAVWGIDDPVQAEAAVRAQLEKLIRVEPGK